MSLRSIKFVARIVVVSSFAGMVTSIWALEANGEGAEPTISLAWSTVPHFSEIVDRYGQAVVNISTSESEHSPTQMRSHVASNRSLGSGFIVRSDGLILTNAHVVSKATGITVQLADHRKYKAQLIGIDKAADVALLRINARNLPKIEMASEVDTRVGDWVLAMGSPFGFNNTISGIISTKIHKRHGANYMSFVQTDVSVVPENTGGPLFNARGEVIGINANTYQRDGWYQGLAYVVPINVAIQVMEQQLSKDAATYGRIGASVEAVTPTIASTSGLPLPVGAYVSSIAPIYAEDQTRLQVGDVILKFNGEEISNPEDLNAKASMVAVGSRVLIDVWRAGSNKQIEVYVDE